VGHTDETELGDEPASLDAHRSKKLLRDLKDNAFLAVVVKPDGDVCVYTKAVGSTEAAQIREAVEERLSGRM
jgi:hypothetical protein